MWEGAVAIIVIILILVIIGIILVVFLTRKTGGILNDPCTTQTDCASGYTCSGGVCKASIGTTCLSNGDCVQDLKCSGGICVVPAPMSMMNMQPQPNVMCTGTCPIRINAEADTVTSSNDCNTNVEDEWIAEVSAGSREYEGHYRRPVVSAYNDDEVLDDSILDACSYSDSTLYLKKDGVIVRETSSTRITVTSTYNGSVARITRLESFSGYLYSVINGKLCQLNNQTYLSNTWSWVSVAGCPLDVTHTSHTLDDKHLWIQSASVGYLYDSELNVVSEYKASGKKRTYGADAGRYIDIDEARGFGYIMPDKKKVTDVYKATLTYHGEIIALNKKDMSLYRDVKLVNWEPYYIKK